MDTMPQARLVIELKMALDARDASRIEKLIRENPRSIMASHVLRNIGDKRANDLIHYWMERPATSARGNNN